MRIAVDTRLWQSNERSELRNFTREVFTRLTLQHEQDNFIFLTDTVSSDQASLPQNVTTVTITPSPDNFLLYKWWYDVKVPLALKKYKADIFIATYGLGSLTTSISQVLIVRDLAFLHNKTYASEKGQSFHKRYIKRFIKKAKRIVTLSNFVKEELVSHYNIDKKQIGVVGSGTNVSFKPFDWEERDAAKSRFAEGCEYFVFPATLHTSVNFLNVLKAFSIFKKWQKTNMKLVIAGRFDAIVEKELERLKSYKYRDDVIIEQDLPEAEIAAVVAGCYALIYPSLYEGFADSVLEALKCEVPVITTENSSISEIAQGAALYTGLEKPDDLSQQMKKIFKDEQLRNQLIEAGKQRSQLFSWDKTAALLWQAIEEAVSK